MICGIQEDINLMVPANEKRYVCIEGCNNKYIEQREYTAKELEKWDELFLYVKELHQLIEMPKAIIIRLQALRNGYDVVKGKREKRFKMGAEYSLMLEAYALADDSIQWCIKNKLRGSNDVRAINYCISIMIGELNEAWLRRKKREKFEANKTKELNRKIHNLSVIDDSNEEENSHVYANSKDELDITDLLQ
ncbi:hypothetical protein EBB07_28290 [Paenibacillaceae bacterium]|nr:hypothetical protein EBB07_28290 [Paenibacillaceae bacterium]